MKKTSILIFILFVVFVCDVISQTKQDSILNVLSESMSLENFYMEKKESQILEMKKMLSVPNLSLEQTYEINLQLYNQYKTYVADSAIYYLKNNISIAEKLKNRIWTYESNLDLVSLYIISGMYLESLSILRSISSKYLENKNDDWLLVKYYDSYKQLYISYSDNNMYTRVYVEKSKLYRDSLLNVLNKESTHYKIVYAEKLYDESKLVESQKVLESIYTKIDSNTHEKAVLAYALANVYQKKGDIDMQTYFLAISANCDIVNSIKENASMRALATVLYETGDINMAYRCIKYSMEDAIFCNARLRTFEISQIFPIIDTAYQNNVNKQKSELQLYLILLSILSLFLIVSISYVYFQMKRVARIRKELYSTNQKLNDLNSDLSITVNKLNNVNLELSESNKIKEVYIGHFLDLCSTYIQKIETFQNSLNKKAMDKKLDELYKMLKSKDMIDAEIKELYQNFDKIFLHLYPNFVQEFNSLLIEEERFVVPPKELLNTELRIFALIRLGITDSSKIAQFLHYSPNTIYNYRTRVRNKASVPRDQFEDLVIKIGAIKYQ